MKNNGFKFQKPRNHVPNNFLPTKQTNILESITDICDVCDKQRFKKRAKKQKQKIANQNYNLEHKSSVPQQTKMGN